MLQEKVRELVWNSPEGRQTLRMWMRKKHCLHFQGREGSFLGEKPGFIRAGGEGKRQKSLGVQRLGVDDSVWEQGHTGGHGGLWS